MSNKLEYLTRSLYFRFSDRHYGKPLFQNSIFNKPYLRIWGKHFFEGGKCLSQVIYDSLSPALLWTKSCDMSNIQIVSYTNTGVINPSSQTKLATLITNFFDVQHGHEAMQDLNDLWSEFMDSKQFKQASDIRKSNLLATVQHVGTFLCKLEVLTLKNEIV